MKRTHIYLLIALIVIGLLIRLVPALVFGFKVRHLQNQLTANQRERNHCEAVQKESHTKAEAIRAKLNTLLGSDFTGDSQSPTPLQTATQQLDQYISGTQIESVSQSQQ